jgi:hypothetical protein
MGGRIALIRLPFSPDMPVCRLFGLFGGQQCNRANFGGKLLGKPLV